MSKSVIRELVKAMIALQHAGDANTATVIEREIGMLGSSKILLAELEEAEKDAELRAFITTLDMDCLPGGRIECTMHGFVVTVPIEGDYVDVRTLIEVTGDRLDEVLAAALKEAGIDMADKPAQGGQV